LITGRRRRNFKLFFRISGFSELKCERTQLGMAHWQGRLSGVSYQSKVADVEASLRAAAIRQGVELATAATKLSSSSPHNC
jgi:hypothetical protein